MLLGVALLLIQLGCDRPVSKESMLEGMSEESRRALTTMTNTPLMVAGIDSPQFTNAANARVRDEELVIGVVVKGESRAYPLSRLSAMADHVVNDCVSDADGKAWPFTVTYCDMTDCIRVLESTSETAAKSLDVSTLGLQDGGLALRWKERPFKQMDATAGLRDLPFQRVSWVAWKAEFPNTLVYKGRIAR